MNADMILSEILKKIEKNAVRFGRQFPNSCRTDSNLNYVLTNGGNWMDSFWPGMLYLAYGVCGDQKFLDFATAYDDFYQLRIENTEEICEKYDFMGLDHDVGFVFSLSAVARYQLTGEEEARKMGIRAADFLAQRFHPKGNFIRAWDTWKWDTDPEFIREKQGKAIIDCTMNLPLLLWAFSETGNKAYQEIAVRHADTVLRYFVREDFSTYHTFNFDPDTGAPIGGKTGQGFADDSCWARGQSWAVYGFALMYAYTKDQKYFDLCVQLSDYFLSHLTDYHMPYWDFGITNVADLTLRPWDSSAACIAACGILELTKHMADGEAKERYRSAVIQMLDSVTRLCATTGLDQIEPLLLHGCVGPAYQAEEPLVIKNHLMDTALIYGDYFYMEAMVRLCRPDIELFW